MRGKIIKTNSVEDLLQDHEFVNSILNIHSEEEWLQFLKNQDGSTIHIAEARKIIQMLRTSEGLLDDERKRTLWSKIHQFDNSHSSKTRRFRLTPFVRIAASLFILLTLGGILFLTSDLSDRTFHFSETKDVLKTDKPLLVLANGKIVELQKSESDITVLKGQDAIQLDNDYIIENKPVTKNSVSDIKLNEVFIPHGKKSRLVLEDGTIVWLNAGSRFAFPSKFVGNTREVVLDGEACFDVAKNANKPFLISTGKMSIGVLGTKFNVNAYSSDNISETVLLEGRVCIWDNSKLFKDKIFMTPNQKATFNKAEKKIELNETLDANDYTAWVDGWYQFTNEDLELVLKKLEKFYDVNFEYDPATKTKVLPVSGKLDLKESLNDVLIVLSKVTKFNYQIDGDVVKIKNSEKNN